MIIRPELPYTYNRTVKDINELTREYGEIITVSCAGKSVRGRDICVIKLGCGKRKILFAGAIHGREYVTTSFLLYSAEMYARAFLENTEIYSKNIRDILCECCFYLVPLCNPDSVEIALGREKPCVVTDDFCAYTYKDNAKGVNLNANFPFEWQSVPAERHHGQSPASEPETRALINLCEKNGFEKMLSLHSRGGCVYWRDKGNGIIDGDLVLASKLLDVCGFDLCRETENIESYAGGFENWFRYKYKRPALCVELVRDENAPFDLCCTEFCKYTDWHRTKYLFLQAV